MKRYGIVIAIVACLAATAAVMAGDENGRLIFQKMLTSLAMPYGMAWTITTLLLIHVVCRKDRLAFVGTLLVWCLLYFGGTGYVAKHLMWRLESPYVQLSDAAPVFDAEGDALDANGSRDATTVRPVASFPDLDVVVVLGGGTSMGPGRGPQAASGGDRIIRTAQLYHQGKVKKILCTGARIPGVDRNELGQAEIAQKLLESLGVAAEDIACIAGRTTAEEMRILGERFPGDTKQVGMITSAWHMQRAERLAHANGFHPLPIPCDFASPVDRQTLIGDFIPSARAADEIGRFVKEWLAARVGR